MSHSTSLSPVEEECVEALKAQFTKEKDLAEDDHHFLTAATFRRFARARDGDIEKASTLLRACCEWRRQYKPHHVKEADVSDIMQLGTVFMAGLCLQRRPIMYMTPGAKNPFPAEKRVKLMVFLLEETMRRGHDSLTWIFDFSKMGERGKDEHSAVTRKETMHILQNYYPERLGALYMVNTPWYFRAIATLVWPFIDKRTRQKINISVKVQNLTQYVAKEELLVVFGGDRILDLTSSEATVKIDELIPAATLHTR